MTSLRLGTFRSETFLSNSNNITPREEVGIDSEFTSETRDKKEPIGM
jgi:hypothetical protein